MKPPFKITPNILTSISMIERMIGRLESFDYPRPQPQLRKSNLVKTLQGSLAIEGNTLNLQQVTAVLDGKRVIAPQNDIQEILNANRVYERLTKLDPHSSQHLLKAHGIMMETLIHDAGSWRTTNVGILKKGKVSHMAPPADRVPYLMEELFSFLAGDDHPLIQGCVFHYEFEFIHPFPDGNGRIGRFWHSLLLYHYHQVFQYIPVESIIKRHQQDYYLSLEACDIAGEATVFIEFSLKMIVEALEEFLSQYHPLPASPDDRVAHAHSHFQERWFTRKDYQKVHGEISTATASRDLKRALVEGALISKGEKATTQYKFTSAKNPV